MYANVYGSHKIIKISWNEAERGKVVEQINYQFLGDIEAKLGINEVFNGIAYHQQSKKYVVTGKLWNYFYIL